MTPRAQRVRCITAASRRRPSFPCEAQVGKAESAGQSAHAVDASRHDRAECRKMLPKRGKMQERNGLGRRRDETQVAVAASPQAGTPIREARSSSSSRVSSPFTERSVANARSARTARGTHSSSDGAKWIRSSTTARSRTSFTSPSRVCLRAAQRELTRPTPAPVRVFDNVNERDVPCDRDVALRLMCGQSPPSLTKADVRRGCKHSVRQRVGVGDTDIIRRASPVHHAHGIGR